MIVETPITVADDAARAAGLLVGKGFPGQPSAILALAAEAGDAGHANLQRGLVLLAQCIDKMGPALTGEPGCASRVKAAAEAHELGQRSMTVIRGERPNA